MDSKEYEKNNDTIQSHKNTVWGKQLKKTQLKMILLSLSLLLVISTILFAAPRLFSGLEKKATVITMSTLKKIINISELSTFQAVYNGIAEVMNEKKPNELDCYVSYQAKVYAGFDFEKVEINLDEKTKRITLTIPEIEITDVNVDIASMDYIFQNGKANKSAITEKAYKSCIKDVGDESEKESAIYELAEQNAKNIMKALISPFVEQLDSDYELEIKSGGVL